jgi:HK97 family phage major capsid protein
MDSIRRIKSETHYRAITLTRATLDEDARTASLAFSSEEPVERWFGTEILDHRPSSIRLKRMQDGGPVLVDHDPADHVGVVEKISIGSDRKGRAVVRFGRGARADEIFRDIVDGIRKNVSVGYRIHKVEVDDPDAKSPTYRATDWEPLEISIVSIPADASVGVGRNFSGENMETKERTTVSRADPAMNGRILAAEREKTNELLEMGELYARHGGRELAARAVREGWDVQRLSDALLEKMSTHPSPAAPVTDLGLTDRETQRYSLLRGLRALEAMRGHGDRRWIDEAGFEIEASRTIADRMERPSTGLLVPYEVLGRDLSAGTANAGGYLVGTENLGASFVDLLRNQMLVTQFGATHLSGLRGNVTIPKLTGAGTAYWLPSEISNITESQQTFGQLSLTPKTVGAYTEITRQLLLQSDPSADLIVMNDLSKVIALAVDLAAINGSGASGQPMGVLNTSGVGSVTGANLQYAGIVEFQTDIGAANGLAKNCGYMTTPTVAALMMQRQRFTNTDSPLWTGSLLEGQMAGFKSASTNQMPAGTMIFGDWSQIVIAEWGVLEVLLNPYANFTAGITGVRAMWSVDVGVRIAGAFSAASSIT